MIELEFYQWTTNYRHPQRYFAMGDLHLTDLDVHVEKQCATCNYCSYTSDITPNFSEENIEKMYKQILHHIYSNHYADAMGVVRYFIAKETALKKGQEILGGI